jgi:hypothetical protein
VKADHHRASESAHLAVVAHLRHQRAALLARY